MVKSGFTGIDIGGRANRLSKWEMIDMQTRKITFDSIPEGFRKLSSSEEATVAAMQELADWCIRNARLIEQGRKYGFRMGASPMMKDIIALASTSPDQAGRINGNLLDVAP